MSGMYQAVDGDAKKEWYLAHKFFQKVYETIKTRGNLPVACLECKKVIIPIAVDNGHNICMAIYRHYNEKHIEVVVKTALSA